MKAVATESLSPIRFPGTPPVGLEKHTGGLGTGSGQTTGVILAVVSCTLLLLMTPSASAAENLARNAKLVPRRSLNRGPFSLANAVDGKVTASRKAEPCQSCWCGGTGDLRYNPLDFVVDFGKPQIIDRVVVTTCRLKNRQRLTDFDVYGWAGADWDGHRPLAAVRGSKQLRMECRFEAVQTAKICIRLLDNARGSHDFPHISELEVYAADGPAQRQLKAGGFVKPVSELTTIAELEAETARLRTLVKSRKNEVDVWRLETVQQKLAARRDDLKWIERLHQIDDQTKQLISEGVPRWAAAQREALSKYILWIHWWIAHQQPDGQFGGHWNDDVELVCGWPLAVLAADDRKTFDSLELLAEGVWHYGSIDKHGYANYTDVEHSAEDISYSQPRMVLLDYDNPKWAERCRRSVMTCRREFMGENDKGMLQFKSYMFGYKNDKAMLDPQRAYDIPEGAKALKPGLYAAWRGDEEIKRIMLRYADTWLEAAMQEYDGKPRGLLPGRIDFPSGKPHDVALRVPPVRAMIYHLMGCYLMTGDTKYLVPVKETIRCLVVEKGSGDLPYLKSGDKECLALGDALSIIASGWRILTQDKTFDPHFARWSRRLAGVMGKRYESFVFVDGTKPDLWIRNKPLDVGAFLLDRRAVGGQFYVGWLATGDKGLLKDGCYNLSCDLTDLWGPLTSWFYDKSERRVTSNDHSAHSIQTAAAMLMLMYTGGYGPIEAKYPYMPVSWAGTTRDFAALVLRADKSHVRLLACNLLSEDREVTMRLWELAPGAYRVDLGPDADGDDQVDEVTQSKTVKIERRTGVTFTLPSRKMQVISVQKEP